MPSILIVVPCFNEEDRLDPAQVTALLSDPRVGVVLVDDGSHDGTLALLQRLAEEHPGRLDVVALPRNGGKGEAVRAGLRHALDRGADVVGYLDADFATPPAEFHRVVEAIFDGPAIVALGSRVRLLGRRIERSPWRHYLGRIFATLGSLALRLDVYDTQCGAKAFSRHPALLRALAEPFQSRWAFDLELLQRLLRDPHDPLGPRDFVEVPLRQWHDAKGSKLRPSGMAQALWDVARIARHGTRPPP